jgi:phage terminase large subunit-like protein
VTATLDQPVSLAERYEAATPRQRASALKRLDADQLRELATAKPWWWWGRGDQFEPEGEHRWWVINAGRGWGKTRTGAETILAKARRYPGSRIALVGPTFADGRDTMVEGESGLLACMGVTELRGSSIDTGWNRSIGELFMGNATRFRIFSSDQPMRLRGPQHHFAWGDEPSYWKDVAKGTDRDGTFSNLNIGLRLPARRGWDDHYRPGGVLTMTPRLVPLLKVPDELVRDRPHLAGLLQRDDVHLTTGSTMANLRNLDRHYYNAVIAPVLGTTLGLQELGGQLLEDVEGALWSSALLSTLHATVEEVPYTLNKLVVAFDPAGGEGLTHDEHGIVVAASTGPRTNLQMWVLDDLSFGGSVDDAARRVILAAYVNQADAIAYEKNQGQDWIASVLRSTYAAMLTTGEVPKTWRLCKLEPVNAVRSKVQRATPIAGYYQQRRVHHVGSFPVLEGQMTTWVPGDSDSPDRLDALVWALTWLYGTGPAQADVASPAGRERRGRRPTQPSSRIPQVYGARTRR